MSADRPNASPTERGPLGGIRILVLFGGSNLFGQERANIEVMRTLNDAGASVCFVTSSRFGREHIQPELTRRGFAWTEAPFGYHWSRHMFGRHFGYFLLNVYGVVATSWRVRRTIRKWKPTHLYTMSWSFFLFALPALSLTKLPLIYRAGDTLPQHTAFHRWVVKRLRRRITRLVCNSEFVARSFKQLGFSPVVIRNHPAARVERDAVALPVRISGSVQLVYVGQIAKHKGIALLVETAIALIRDGFNLMLLVAGDSVWGDTLRKELEESVRRAGLTDRIHFLGSVEDIPSILRASDIHVCPSIWDDPSPNVIVEAKREGIPTVAFPVGGVPELIQHGVDGFLCREVSAPALIEGLRYFLEESKRTAASSAARKSYETDFGFSSFQRQWTEIISSGDSVC